MGTLAAGQVVVLSSQFSDLSQKKLHPALLLADAGRGDWIACQITSNPCADTHAITLTDSEFVEGGLQRTTICAQGNYSPATNRFRSIPLAHSTKPHCNRLAQRLFR